MSRRGYRTVAPVVALASLLACGAPPIEVPHPDVSDSEPVVVDALRVVTERVDTEPDSLEAWIALGDRLMAHGWDAEAGRCFARAEQLDPSDFLWPYLQGLCIADTDLAGSADAFARAVGLDPGYPPARVSYGRSLLNLGRPEEAREQFTAATAGDPASPHAWMGLGQCAIAAGEWAVARNALERAVALDPGLGEAHHLLSQTYVALGMEAEAARISERARRLPKESSMPDPRAHRPVEPVGSRAHNDRGIVLVRQGRDAEAESHFRESLRVNPEYAEAHYNLGTVLARSGRTDEAIAHLRDAVRLGPGYADAEVNLGLALRSAGEYDEAVAHFREALRIDPGHAMAHVHLADTLAAGGDLDDAMESYRNAVDADPGGAPAWKLAWVLATHRDDSVRDGEEAVELASAACRATAFGDPRALDALAAAYAETGRFADAVIAGRKAASLAATDPRLAAAIRERVAVYESGRPYRDGPR